jgi:hypothetical protein
MMKKLLILFIVTFIVGKSFGQISSTMKIIDHPKYIEILDSSALDTNYAPIIIKKDGWTYAETDYNNKNGSVKIFVRSYTNGYQSYITLDARRFNDFNNNDELRDYLNCILYSDFSGYTLLYNINGDNNIDTIWYKVPFNNDTSFLRVYYWTSTILDSSKYIQDDE